MCRGIRHVAEHAPIHGRQMVPARALGLIRLVRPAGVQPHSCRALAVDAYKPARSSTTAIHPAVAVGVKALRWPSRLCGDPVVE